jgi:hypothetical protein
LNEGKVVGSKPVMARRHPTTLFDPVEEPLDPVASAHGRRAALARISDQTAVFRQVERHGPHRAQRQPYRQTIAIDTAWIFARQAAAGSSHRLELVPWDAGPMLMHADNGGVDHLDSGTAGSGKRL